MAELAVTDGGDQETTSGMVKQSIVISKLVNSSNVLAIRCLLKIGAVMALVKGAAIVVGAGLIMTIVMLKVDLMKLVSTISIAMLQAAVQGSYHHLPDDLNVNDLRGICNGIVDVMV